MRPGILNSLLCRAAAEPFGLVLETNNPNALNVNYLQPMRTQHHDPTVRRLIIAIPSTPNTVFICQPNIDLEVEPEISE